MKAQNKFSIAFLELSKKYNSQNELSKRDFLILNNCFVSCVRMFTKKYDLSFNELIIINKENLIYYFDLSLRMAKLDSRKEKENLNCSMFSKNPIEEIQNIINTTFLKG
tara:strand:+ start:52 stop:378 length:327 start_codon:yes stop_codon:yes gene_type:complete